VANLGLAGWTASGWLSDERGFSFSSLVGIETIGGVGLDEIVEGAGDGEALVGVACFSLRLSFLLLRKTFFKSSIAGISTVERREEKRVAQPKNQSLNTD
jgi:hypothetical protein